MKKFDAILKHDVALTDALSNFAFYARLELFEGKVIDREPTMTPTTTGSS
jgi:hypothetical protein